MGAKSDQRAHSDLWTLVDRQHGVVSRTQLLESGLSANAITHRIATGRLRPVRRGIYAVGRPQISRHGWWLAAVLACGPEAVLSHETAAALWRIRSLRSGRVEVSVPDHLRRRSAGVTVHRRVAIEVTRHQGIPVTDPICTLIDLAARLSPDQLEAAVNEADKLDLIDPERLRAALDRAPRRPGIRTLRRLLDRRTFRLTDSELERRFLRLARDAGLPMPATGRHVNGHKVDFFWPDLGLVIEADGLRYHRTPAQQARDRVRDQTHAAAGLTPLRFTDAQVRWEPRYVRSTLSAVARRLQQDPD